MRNFQEIHDVAEVLLILEKRLPRSGNIYNMVKFKGQLKINVFTLCLTNDTMDTWIVVTHCRKDYGKELVISIPPNGADKVCEKMKMALRNNPFLDWNEKYFFLTLERPLSFLIIQLGLENGNILDIHPSSYFYVKDRPLPDIQCPEEIEIRKLTKLDAEVIAKNWKYSKDSTIEYIREVIDLPNAGLFHNGKLISYAITSAYGLPSFLHTDEDHRRKGYGKIAMVHILKELKRSGLIPISACETQNKSSVDLHSKCNLEFLYDTDFIIHS